VSVRGSAVIVGAYEHPERIIPDGSVAGVVAEVAHGALADAGLGVEDVDGFCYAGVHQGVNLVSMADHLGLGSLSYYDSTDTGGASYPTQIGHAALAIAAGVCSVVLVAMGGLARSQPRGSTGGPVPQDGFEGVYGLTQPAAYAIAAQRHRHEFGTTAEQLAQVRVAASHHAQFNPHALYRDPVTVEQVLDSPLISDPLHRLDCCVTTDGGGAVVLVSPEVARRLPRRGVRVVGHGEAVKTPGAGRIDLVHSAAAVSGPRAFAQAGISVGDIDMVSLYDSFTITVLMSLEDLGFCAKGEGGRFVADGALLAPHGALPFNTDGGGLCNNHPDRRGGMIRTIEAVRQLRGEAAPQVQVPDCEFALVQGQGHALGTRSAASTLILGRQDVR
jgi:acetyl-CoA C-acetyltransferase